MGERHIVEIRRMELYKRFRPSRFKDLIGNRETVMVLEEYLRTNTLPHTLLIHGPSGCGKTTTARILASELGVADVDLVEMNCASQRGIDTIREIQSVMRLSPWGGKYRAWILDEAHMLTKEAQNSALKMLEDTPRHVYFFVCTTDPGKLIPTIRNRSTHVPVSPLTEDDLMRLIWRTSKRANVRVPKSVASDIATAAEGSARKALVMLDKIRHLSPKEMTAALDERDAAEQQAIDLCRALINPRTRWNNVAPILRNLTGEPEQIRHAVLGYAKAVLLKGSTNPRAFAVLCAFELSFYDSKMNGLVRACFEVVQSG